MKKLILCACVCACGALSLQAFSLGGLTKSVSQASAETASADTQAALAKQSSALSKYKESKTSLLQGYQYVLGCFDVKDIKADLSEALQTVKNAKDADYAKIMQTANAVLENKSYADLLSNAKTALSDAAKAQYAEGLGYFTTALQKQIEVGEELSEGAKLAKKVIDNGSALEKAQLALSLEPTLNLAQEIGGDIKTVKGKLASVVKFAKQQGIAVPSALTKLL